MFLSFSENEHLQSFSQSCVIGLIIKYSTFSDDTCREL